MKHINPPDPWTPEMAALRRELRTLVDLYPTQFETMLRLIAMAGENWRSLLPPQESAGDRPQQATRETLALLLADYRNRLPKTRQQFLEDLVGARFGNAYFVGAFATAETAAYYLKQAEALAKTDPDFDAYVETWRPALREID